MLDLDDVLEALFEGVGLRGLPASKRTQGCVRVFFGTVLCGLSLVGAWKTLDYDASLHFRVAGATLFLALAAFGLLNIVFLRKWRWPGCLFVLAFFGLFAVRILFGP
ncbi:MAG TPA: hypothetical protein VI942_03270 [Thermoanaerobaculia bacterium]|nr:hypothetical protein [Thermoanaerobaculia bacterium]